MLNAVQRAVTPSRRGLNCHLLVSCRFAAIGVKPSSNCANIHIALCQHIGHCARNIILKANI